MRIIILFFLLLLSSITLYSQSILTRGEVYDFNIGDEFQYSVDNFPGTWVVRYTVIDKQLSQNGDTLFYSMSQSNYSYGPDGNGGSVEQFWEDTTHSVITNLNDPATTFGDSTQIYDIYQDSTYFYYPDTIIEYDSNLCNLEVNGWDSYPPVFESNQIIRIYGKGVGLVWHYHYDPSTPSSPNIINYKLYYYKKGSVTCGTPNTVSVESYIQEDIEVNVYPVPSDKQINIETEEGVIIKQIELISIDGKILTVKCLHKTEDKYSIDSESIPKGVYFINIVTNQGVFKRKVMVAHN